MGRRPVADHHSTVTLLQHGKDGRLKVFGLLPGSLRGPASYQRRAISRDVIERRPAAARLRLLSSIPRKVRDYLSLSGCTRL